MPDRTVDRAIDGLARRQHGAFNRRQAVRVGCTDDMIRYRVDTGDWLRLRGSQVFALPSHPGTWLRQCMAATLAILGSALSGATAAAILGFPDHRRGRIEVVTRYGSSTRSPFGPVRRSRTLGRLQVVEGIRVVSHADAVLQLAGGYDADSLGDLVDTVAIGRRTLLDELRERYVAVAASRLPGIGAVRSMLDARGPGYVPPAGELELVLRRVLAGVPGLPPVTWEATPPWLEPGAGRVDALIDDWRLVVEADGRDWHTRVLDFERDRWRDTEALAHGYATLRLSYLRLTTDAVSCRNRIAAAGAHRAR